MSRQITQTQSQVIRIKPLKPQDFCCKPSMKQHRYTQLHKPPHCTPKLFGLIISPVTPEQKGMTIIRVFRVSHRIMFCFRPNDWVSWQCLHYQCIRIWKYTEKITFSSTMDIKVRKRQSVLRSMDNCVLVRITTTSVRLQTKPQPYIFKRACLP